MKISTDLLDNTFESPTQACIDVTPPPSRRYERAKLQGLRDIGNEIAKVYRLARSGELDPSVATKLTYILSTLAKVRVEGDLEKRLEALEQREIL